MSIKYLDTVLTTEKSYFPSVLANKQHGVAEITKESFQTLKTSLQT